MCNYAAKLLAMVEIFYFSLLIAGCVEQKRLNSIKSLPECNEDLRKITIALSEMNMKVSGQGKEENRSARTALVK